MICVDASVIVAVLQPEEYSPKAVSLIRQWRATNEQMVAPDLLIPEVSSIIRRELFAQRTEPEEAETAIRAFKLLPVSLYPTQPLMDRAWTWGAVLNTPRLYDLYYLALADQLDCDLWVVDKRLVNTIAGKSSRVRWVGDVEDGPKP